MAISTSPSAWLVQFISLGLVTGGQEDALKGMPWADGTDMASRYPSPTPWDQGCTVQPYIGGLAAMSAMCTDLEKAIANAKPGQDNGYVFIVDWRFNCLRDLGGGPDYAKWSGPYLDTDVPDRTAIGLVLRLMQAGIQVWLMLWYPTHLQAGQVRSHVADHRYAAALVGAENARLQAKLNTSQIYGAVALDCRVADNGRAAIAAAHHQKFLIIRSGGINRAYMGGVDLAFTRRDAPPGKGDWQSGSQLPPFRPGWPRQMTGLDYSSVDNLVKPGPKDNPGTDLPAADNPKAKVPLTIYGDTNHIWHDRHLCLDGPIVQTLDSHFRERWSDAANAFALSFITLNGKLTSVSGMDEGWGDGDVLFSSTDAMASNSLPPQPAFTASTVPMPSPPAGQPSPSSGQSIAQMWRTMPVRRSRPGTQKYLQRGEFTVVDGLVKAISQSTQLIWIFDQYFWSQPFARLLNARLRQVSSLYVILVLPPHADGSDPDDSVARAQHTARYMALTQLVQNVPDRVGVYAMWQSPAAGGAPGGGQGIYVHAKSHIYDGTLLVTGSANINRRSLTGDSELMCAVVDQPMTLGLMQSLWTQLFPATRAPAIDTTATDWGARFFASFAAAAATPVSASLASTALVYVDTPPATAVSVALPSGAQRNLLKFWNRALDWYDWFLESSSVDYAGLEDGDADLATVQTRLNQYSAPLGKPVEFPFRTSSRI